MNMKDMKILSTEDLEELLESGDVDIKTITVNSEEELEELLETLGNAGAYIPKFDREDGIVPSIPDSFDSLANYSDETLKAIGCMKWDEPDKDNKVLWLFPKEWYDYIPNGFQVYTIGNVYESFTRGESDDETRMGMLPYGIRK